MGKKANIIIRVDQKLKSKAISKCKDYRATLSQYIRACLKILIKTDAFDEFNKSSVIPSEKDRFNKLLNQTNLRQYLLQLSRIGNNLNQLTFQINKLMKSSRDSLTCKELCNLNNNIQTFQDEIHEIDARIRNDIQSER